MIDLLRTLAIICQVNVLSTAGFVSLNEVQSTQKHCVMTIISCIRTRQPKILASDAVSIDDIQACL